MARLPPIPATGGIQELVRDAIRRPVIFNRIAAEPGPSAAPPTAAPAAEPTTAPAPAAPRADWPVLPLMLTSSQGFDQQMQALQSTWTPSPHVPLSQERQPDTMLAGLYAGMDPAAIGPEFDPAELSDPPDRPGDRADDCGG